MTILKVQFNDEIRRVTIEDDCDLTDLTGKVRYMFPQLRNFVISYFASGDWVEIKSNEDLTIGVMNAKLSFPPVFRICIKPVDEPIQVDPELEPELLPCPVVTPTFYQDTSSIDSDLPPSVEILEEEEEEKEKEVAPTQDVVSNTQEIVTPQQETETLPKCTNCKQETSMYKCINCYNLYLCIQCEPESQSMHNPNHLLVKLNRPVTQLPLKQQLIFTQHIEHFPSDSAKLDSKTQSKSIRTAIREASLVRKQERSIRRDQMNRCSGSRRTSARKSKSCKVVSTTVTPVSVAVEVLPLVQCETAVVEIAPEVCSRTVSEIVQLEDMVDPLPQAIVPEENAIVVELSEALEPSKEEDVEEKEEEAVVEEEMVQQEEERGEGEGWNIMNRIGWRRGDNGGLNENEYRIQGIGFWEKLEKLEKMGFEDRNRNMLLLAKNLCNLERTVDDLTC